MKDNVNDKIDKDKIESGEKEISIKKVKQSPFITEDDIFDVSVKFYREGQTIKVEGVDEDFDSKNDAEVIRCSFKYVSEGDAVSIAAMINSYNIHKSFDDMTIHDYSCYELVRFMVLLRKWSLDEEISNESIFKLHPRIVKALCRGITNVIATDGLV